MTINTRTSGARTLRARFTLIELLIVAALAALLIAIILPVALDKGVDKAQLTAITAVQDAIRRYKADTGSYPTLGPVAATGQTPVSPWNAGDLPAIASVPRFAGIDFSARAFKTGTDTAVPFHPDYIKERPRHDSEVASDATQRWRIDATGAAILHMDGRSY
ncbi:MAG: hypothetical protein EXR49_07750 [Dehalococcoidia bacterium]|nr:hypothetical protein [Dehalococcoidia bacterium]